MKSNSAYPAIIALLLYAVGGYAQANYLDGSFGTNGISLAPSFKPAAMAIQEDGKILVTGTRVPGGASNAKVYRFNADGTPDLDFGSQGAAVAGNSTAYVSVSQLTDGKILLVGSVRVGFTGSTGTVVFARLHGDGSPDVSFGTDGIFQVPEYAQHSAQQKIAAPVKVKFLPDGSVICAGMIGYTLPNPLANGPMFITRLSPMITKFNPDFTLDTTFAGIGYLKLPYTVASQFTALDVLEDGSMIAGLRVSGDVSQGGGNIKLYKYLPNGTLDTAFGTSGIKIIDAGSSDDRITDLRIMADGKILISGSVTGNSRNAFIARLAANGNLDQGYGSGGILVFPNASGHAENAVQSLVLENGTIISGLQRWNSGNASYEFSLTGTDGNGNLINSFGDGGQVITAFDQDQILHCLIRQTDGKILAAGNNEDNMMLMRYGTTELLYRPLFSGHQAIIYPNPVVDRLNIAGMKDNSSVVLYNSYGQKVIESVINGEGTIDVSSLPRGVYIVKTASRTEKIVKK